MIRFLGLMAVTCVGAIAGSQAGREVTSEAVLGGGLLLPEFYAGHLYFIDGQDAVRLYGPDGHLVLATVIEGDHSGAVAVESLAVDGDGNVAVSWSVSSADGGHGGIDFLDHTGRRTGSVNTGRYRPAHLAYGDDHALWAFGWQEPAARDYATVRKFSAEGRLIGEFMPRSLFPKGLEPAGLGWQATAISVTRDRIGLLAIAGASGSDREWVELNLDGTLKGRWKAYGNQGARVVLTEDGFVYAQDRNSKEKRLVKLDRATADWKETGVASDESLYGAQGDELVFASAQRGPMHLRWDKQP